MNDLDTNIENKVKEIIKKDKSKLTILMWIFGSGWTFLCGIAVTGYKEFSEAKEYFKQSCYVNSKYPNHEKKDDSVDAIFFKDIDTLKNGQSNILTAIANKKYTK